MNKKIRYQIALFLILLSSIIITSVLNLNQNRSTAQLQYDSDWIKIDFQHLDINVTFSNSSIIPKDLYQVDIYINNTDNVTTIIYNETSISFSQNQTYYRIKIYSAFVVNVSFKISGAIAFETAPGQTYLYTQMNSIFDFTNAYYILFLAIFLGLSQFVVFFRYYKLKQRQIDAILIYKHLYIMGLILLFIEIFISLAYLLFVLFFSPELEYEVYNIIDVSFNPNFNTYFIANMLLQAGIVANSIYPIVSKKFRFSVRKKSITIIITTFFSIFLVFIAIFLFHILISQLV